MWRTWIPVMSQCPDWKHRGVGRSRVEAGLLVALLACGLVLRPAAQEPKSSVREVANITGTVERIDRFTRLLTLRMEQNVTQTVSVAPDIKLFDQLKTGDRVTVRVVEEVIVAVRPGLKPTIPIDTTAEARAATPQGDTQVQQQLKAVVTVERIDPRMQTVIYQTGDNRRIIRQVADPQLLEGLKPGDVIEITYTRQRAIELQRR
jgi:Cu/Ag efflux protein CusF